MVDCEFNGPTDANVRTASRVVWAVEADGILLVVTEEVKSHKLNQLESALWQMITIASSRERLSQFLCAVLGISKDEAQKRLEDLIHSWREAGYLD